MKNVKFYSLAKIWLIVLVAVVVIGTVMFSFLGFNSTAEFGKGYEISVSTEVDMGDRAGEFKGIADDFFASKGVKYQSYRLNGEDAQKNTWGFELVFVFDKPVDASVKTELLAEYNSKGMNNDTDPNSLTVEVDGHYTDVVNDKSFVLGTVLASLGAVVVAMVYLFFRQKFVNAFTVAVSTVASALLFFAFTAITRIPVVSGSYAVFAMAVVATLALSAFYTGKTKDSQKKYTEGSKLDAVGTVDA
ncbi:MAG: hypothetical protein MJ072_01675, partial [Clostridia bacterium]|nr:hypothetical protein [Clostridia bacterium]